jgi:hypothetical protein
LRAFNWKSTRLIWAFAANSRSINGVKDCSDITRLAKTWYNLSLLSDFQKQLRAFSAKIFTALFAGTTFTGCILIINDVANPRAFLIF